MRRQEFAERTARDWENLKIALESFLGSPLHDLFKEKLRARQRVCAEEFINPNVEERRFRQLQGESTANSRAIMVFEELSKDVSRLANSSEEQSA